MMVTVAIDDSTELQVRVPARAPWTRGDTVKVSYVGDAANSFA